MKITHVNFARGFRGGERQTFNLIQGLAAQGMEQSLICRSGSELKRRVSALGVSAIELAHPLLGHLNPPQTDIIHVHEARGAYWAALEHLMRATPYIITRRIPNPISDSRITGSVYRNAVRLLGVSRDVSKRLSLQTGLQVGTILSSTTTHAADPAAVRQIRGKLGGGPVIGHVGALHDHHKGQSVLIKAFHKLLREMPQARLVFVGEGSDRALFEHLALHDERIHFAGFQRDIGSWIAAMDVFAFPSREEGLGSSVLDAMALRVPVVTSAVGGLPELTGNNERGLLVADHDPDSWEAAIRRLLTDAPMRARQVRAANDFALENGVSKMSKNYLALYGNICRDMASAAEHAEHVMHEP